MLPDDISRISVMLCFKVLRQPDVSCADIANKTIKMKVNQPYTLGLCFILANIFCHFQVAAPSVSAHLSIRHAGSLEFAFKVELIYPVFYLLSSE